MLFVKAIQTRVATSTKWRNFVAELIFNSPIILVTIAHHKRDGKCNLLNPPMIVEYFHHAVFAVHNMYLGST